MFLLLAKIGLFGMFINYYPYNIMVGSFIPYGTLIFFAMVLLGICGDVMIRNHGQFILETEFRIWLIYFALAYATSYLCAVSVSSATDALNKFAMRLILIFAVAYICEEEHSILFPIRLLAVIAVLSAAAAFTQMGDIAVRLELESDASISINDFGSLMAYGCFAGFIALRNTFIKSGLLVNLLTVGCSILLWVEVAISGSRKSFYAVLLLYALLILCVWARGTNNNSLYTLFSFLIIIAVLVLAYNKLSPYFSQTSLYERVFGEKADFAAESDESRLTLYKMAISDFISHPLFGLGFNNFKYVHGVYTHSTYADPMACSGIIGLFYLVPVFSVLGKQISLVRRKFVSYREHLRYSEILIFYIVFLAIGAGIPYIYKDLPCVVFGMMFAWVHLTYKRDEVIEF